METVTTSQLITTKAASKMLGVSHRTLWGMTAPRGDIPCVKFESGSVRYDVADLEAWIEQQKLSPI